MGWLRLVHLLGVACLACQNGPRKAELPTDSTAARPAPSASASPSSGAGPASAPAASVSPSVHVTAADSPPPAFLGGLLPDAKLGPASVVAIGSVVDGRLPIEVRIEANHGILEIALRDDSAPPPVAATERYAIYWRSGGPGTNWLVASDLEEVAVALGQRILAAEKTAPVPAGLTKFVEHAKQPALGL